MRFRLNFCYFTDKLRWLRIYKLRLIDTAKIPSNWPKKERLVLFQECGREYFGIDLCECVYLQIRCTLTKHEFPYRMEDFKKFVQTKKFIRAYEFKKFFDEFGEHFEDIGWVILTFLNISLSETIFTVVNSRFALLQTTTRAWMIMSKVQSSRMHCENVGF